MSSNAYVCTRIFTIVVAFVFNEGKENGVLYLDNDDDFRGWFSSNFHRLSCAIRQIYLDTRCITLRIAAFSSFLLVLQF